MPKINFKQQQSTPPPNKVKLVPSGIFIQDPTTEEPPAEESEETAPPATRPFDFGRELQRLLNSETTARSQIDGVKPLSHLSAIRRVAASEVSLLRKEVWHLVETEEDERTMRQTIYLQFEEGMKRV